MHFVLIRSVWRRYLPVTIQNTQYLTTSLRRLMTGPSRTRERTRSTWTLNRCLQILHGHILVFWRKFMRFFRFKVPCFPKKNLLSYFVQITLFEARLNQDTFFIRKWSTRQRAVKDKKGKLEGYKAPTLIAIHFGPVTYPAVLDIHARTRGISPSQT